MLSAYDIEFRYLNLNPYINVRNEIIEMSDNDSLSMRGAIFWLSSSLDCNYLYFD